MRQLGVSAGRSFEGDRVAGLHFPVVPGGDTEPVADQVDDAGLNRGQRLAGRDRLGRAPQPVTHDDAHVLDAPVLDLGEHAEPELRALAAVVGPDTAGCPARRSP